MGLSVAHLSDLHVSRFGEHVTSLRTNARSRGRAGAEPWETLQAVEGWRIEKRPRRGWLGGASDDPGLDLRLVDAAGYVQERRRADKGQDAQVLEALLAIAAERQLTEHSRLARRLPDPSRVEALLRMDPSNTNLKFLRAAYQVLEAKPDFVLITGDVTDDGVGYDLVLAALAPLVEKGRVLAVPGNHDVYASPRWVVPAHERKVVAEKRALWRPFSEALGLPAEPPWARELGRGTVVFGLDSCTPNWAPMSASGEVPKLQLARVADLVAKAAPACAIAMLHHHVVNVPVHSVGRSPWQLGMSLRNAREVFRFLIEQRFTAVLNGHRHLGYRYHPAQAPLFVSSPSTTLGCRTGVRPYYWWLSLEDGRIESVRERDIVEL